MGSKLKNLLKEKPRFLSSSPLIFPFGLSALVIFAATFTLALSFGTLPQEVPLLFTTSQALTSKSLLFAVPALSVFFVVVDAIAAEVLLRRGEKAAAVFPAFLGLFVSSILSGSLFRIVRVFPISPLPFERLLYPLLLPLAVSITLGLLLTYATILVARKLRLFDRPHGPYPKVRPIPRLGAIPIFLTFTMTALAFTPADRHLVAFLAGAALITIIQTVDDVRPLPPLVQGAGHVLAALIIVAGGGGVDFIRNPLSQWVGGPYIRLDAIEIPIALFGTTYHFTVLADLFTVLWVFALINVVDWIDGLDGLAAGVGTLAGATIVLISFMAQTPATAVLGTILVGTLLGFLPLNFYPAKIYLGGGAFLLGYLLAVLSIFSGAKTGTAILVLAIPIIDAAFVIYRRLRAGKSPFKGDKTHLHHRLLEAGFAHPHIVFLEWFVVLALAVTAVALSGFAKFAAVALVFAATLLANRLLLAHLESRAQKL
ncbi:hypothetical protein GTO10_02205 [Candidatus Saccharibacteria bacterium]|nr:hypothetical protein [Candidatus Saccharibacteria bacterium]